MEYTVENINALISSINNNTSTMRDMLCQLRNSCTGLNCRLAEYASKQISLSNEQIYAYQNYISEYNKIKGVIDNSNELVTVHAPVKLLSDITSIISFCGKLLDIHHKQLEIIDRLCSLLQKSNDVIKLIA
jgi:hypothetical protein